MERRIKLFENFDNDLDLWNTYMSIIDGIDGIISEHGELNDSYWKDGVEEELDEITSDTQTVADVKKNKERIIANLKDLLDGLDGVIQSRSISVDKYFKSGVIEAAKKKIEDL